MRIRPFFWIFLATVCTGVLVFAAAISAYKALPMRAHIEQVSTTSAESTLVRLSLTDLEGVPIDQALITPRVSMLTMQMGPQQIKVEPLGEGLYLAQIHFSMAGAWKIDIAAYADGFDAVQQSIQLMVL